MDYLAKKREYLYSRHGQRFRAHTILNRNLKHEIWIEGKSKLYRKTAVLVDKALNKINDEVIPPIVIVDGKCFKAICAYNSREDAIFVNNQLDSSEVISSVLADGYFASRNLTDMLKHEIGHRLHRQAAKRYYFAHQSRYNNVNEAKHDLDADVERIVKEITMSDKINFICSFSQYAYETFNRNNEINDVVAEFCVKGNLPKEYQYLEKKIKGVLSYGRNGYHGITK